MNDLDADTFEQRIRARRRGVWITCTALLTGGVLLVGTWCTRVMRESSASGEPEPLPPELIPQMQAIQAAQDATTTVPAGILDAIVALDATALREAPACPRVPPGGARAYSAEELRAAPVRAPSHRVQVIVVGDHQEPMLTSLDEYRGGHVRGVAYLWDDDADAIVCAGAITAESSPGIDYFAQITDVGAGRRALDADFSAAVDAAVTASLHAVEP